MLCEYRYLIVLIFINILEDMSAAIQAPELQTQVASEKTHTNIRQQDKIIATLLRNNYELLREPVIQVSQAERETYKERVRLGSIGEEDYKRLVTFIKPNTAYEQDKNNPVSLFNQMKNDNQMRGIVAYFSTGNLNNRDGLTIKDFSSFAYGRMPNAYVFEQYIGQFLDRIEAANGQGKRKEYERTVQKLGILLYGKQWEYLQQIRLLEDDAKNPSKKTPDNEVITRPESNNNNLGLEQTRKFNKDHRLRGPIADGYRDGGRTTSFDADGKALNPTREIIIVDRARDENLQKMIAQAKAIAKQYGSGTRAAFEIAQLVYRKMYDSNAQAITDNFGKGQIMPIGEIQTGVCRHRSLLFQVLASEIGMDTTLVRGNAAAGAAAGGHAWNELTLDGTTYIVDVMNPPPRHRIWQHTL